MQEKIKQKAPRGTKVEDSTAKDGAKRAISTTAKVEKASPPWTIGQRLQDSRLQILGH